MFKIQTSPLLAWDRSHRHLAMHGLLNFKKKRGKSFEDLYNTTMEQIQLNPLYTEMDYEGMHTLTIWLVYLHSCVDLIPQCT